MRLFLHVKDSLMLNVRNIAHIYQNGKNIVFEMNYNTAMYVLACGGSDAREHTITYPTEQEAKRMFEAYKNALVEKQLY